MEQDGNQTASEEVILNLNYDPSSDEDCYVDLERLRSDVAPLLQKAEKK